MKMLAVNKFLQHALFHHVCSRSLFLFAQKCLERLITIAVQFAYILAPDQKSYKKQLWNFFFAYFGQLSRN